MDKDLVAELKQEIERLRSQLRSVAEIAGNALSEHVTYDGGGQGPPLQSERPVSPNDGGGQGPP